jgi:hypothetical protein
MIDPSEEPDYYAVLQVPPDATAANIERSYRRLAGRKMDARFRQGRAARELALVNAAYGVLGYPDRRADYDRRRAEADALAEGGEPVQYALPEPEPALVSYSQARRASLPRVQLGRTHGASPLDAVIIILVVGLALFVASSFMNHSLVDLSFIQRIGETAGVVPRQRTPTPPTPPGVAPAASPVAVPSPGAAASPAVPVAPPGALPTNVAGQRFAGSEVVVSEPEPARNSNLTVTLRLSREGRPVEGANVYLTAHYRTLDERQPPGTSTVRTDGGGVANITFNIGEATPGFQVNVDVTALVEGQQVVFQTSFTPR